VVVLVVERERERRRLGALTSSGEQVAPLPSDSVSGLRGRVYGRPSFLHPSSLRHFVSTDRHAAPASCTAAAALPPLLTPNNNSSSSHTLFCSSISTRPSRHFRFVDQAREKEKKRSLLLLILYKLLSKV